MPSSAAGNTNCCWSLLLYAAPCCWQNMTVKGPSSCDVAVNQTEAPAKALKKGPAASFHQGQCQQGRTRAGGRLATCWQQLHLPRTAPTPHTCPHCTRATSLATTDHWPLPFSVIVFPGPLTAAVQSTHPWQAHRTVHAALTLPSIFCTVRFSYGSNSRNLTPLCQHHVPLYPTKPPAYCLLALQSTSRT